MLILSTKALVALAIAALLLFARNLRRRLRDPLNRVPGPWYAKFSSLPFKFAVVRASRIHYVQSLHEKYGPYVRLSPGQVAVNDPVGYKQIHGVASGFGKSLWYQQATSLGRPTLFTFPDNKVHSQRRRLFAQACSKSAVRQHWETTIKERISLAVSKMREDTSTSGITDILKWWTLMASDVVSHLSFGDSFHSVESGEINDFIKFLLKALKGNGIGAEIPPIRAIGKRLPFQATKQLFDTSGSLKSYAASALQGMLAEEGRNSIFCKIQAEADNPNGAVDSEDVELEAIALLVAGTDTTAVTLTYLVWAVLLRPDLQDQLEAEVATLPQNYTDSDVESLTLLNAVIHETLRLYGAVPGGLPRIVPEGGVDMGGFYMPQGTTVSTHAFSMHRDPILFPRPHEFDVKRWLPSEDGKNSHAIPDEARAVFTPFGSGSRSCLGVHIAWTELRLAVAEFFRRCPGSHLDLSTTPGSMEMENFFSIIPVSHRCHVVIN